MHEGSVIIVSLSQIVSSVVSTLVSKKKQKFCLMEITSINRSQHMRELFTLIIKPMLIYTKVISLRWSSFLIIHRKDYESNLQLF